MESKTDSAEVTLASFPRFGDCAYRQADVIEFPWGLPGYPALHRWLFLTLDSQPSFVWLQSLDDVDVAIPAANPWYIFQEYNPVVPIVAFTALGIARPEEFTYLCTVTASPGAREMTMNLAAPIVVNLLTRKALQIALPSSAYSTRELIPRKSNEAHLTAKAS